jgi:arsenate reductase
MAEEYCRKLGGDIFKAESAGLEPGEINPYVIRVLQEEGIDISDKKTKSVKDIYNRGDKFNYVITVCDRETEEKCPVFPRPAVHMLWGFPDPSALKGTDEEILIKTRKIRDVIKMEVEQFIQNYKMKHHIA